MVKNARQVISYNKMFADSLELGRKVSCFSLMTEKETERIFPSSFNVNLSEEVDGKHFSKTDSTVLESMMDVASKFFSNKQSYDDDESNGMTATVSATSYGPVSPSFNDNSPIDPAPEIPPSYGDDENRIDWRNFEGVNYVTRVKDQGRCGSCWAFASVAAVESFMLINREAYGTINLSEQFVIDCTQPGDPYINSCNGGHTNAGMEFIANYGIATERSRGYQVSKGYCRRRSPKTIKRPQFVPVQLGLTFDRSDDNVWKIIEALRIGPVTVNMFMDSNGMQYGSGVLKCSPRVNKVNHSVLLVGFDMTGTQPHWIIKNSFGPRWGANGFFKLAMDPRYDCNLSRFKVISPQPFSGDEYENSNE